MEDCMRHSLVSPYTLLFKALSLIPMTHYLLFFLSTLLIFLCNLFEIHFLHHLLTFFRGDPVLLTCNFSSELYQSVASKCSVLHGRFSSTSWLSSPHLQTIFLSIFGKCPDVVYERHLFQTSDGGTIALDWLMSSDIAHRCASYKNEAVQQDNKAPIVVVIPGLTSDSAAAYIKHLAFAMARRGWNVVVSNHRGLGGVSITSDRFYNAGWTEDLRSIIDYIHCKYPDSPLYAVGTSIGANILVKYLGEHGVSVPLTGAAAICCPWDLLIGDRFINRRLVQKMYDIILAVGLQGYAQSHHSVMSRLIDMESMMMSRSIRNFDMHATRVLANYETVDTYYRRASCVNVVNNVSVPLLCVSALDDPVCTREAIPWDECRENENIVLATTKHGGHLAYYEGISANSMWWVRAVNEFFHVLHSSPLRNRRKVEGSNLPVLFESSIDQAPYVNVVGDGIVATIGNTHDTEVEKDTCNDNRNDVKNCEETSSERERSYTNSKVVKQQSHQSLVDLIVHVKRYMGQLARQNRISLWLLAYIAVVTTWPLVGSALLLFIKRKFKNIKNIQAALLRK